MDIPKVKTYDTRIKDPVLAVRLSELMEISAQLRERGECGLADRLDINIRAIRSQLLRTER